MDNATTKKDKKETMQTTKKKSTGPKPKGTSKKTSKATFPIVMLKKVRLGSTLCD